MLPSLEELYRRLMFAYPVAYREAREDEIIGTLLEAASPGQRFPGPRESVGLILAGLHARGWVRGQGGVHGDWAGSLRVAAAFLVAFVAAQAVPGSFMFQTIRPHLIPIALVLTAVALLRGIGRWGLALVGIDLFLVAPGLSTVVAGYALSRAPAWLSRIAGLAAFVPDVLPLAAATAAFAWTPGRRRTPRWPWWVAAAVAAGPALLQISAFRYPWVEAPWLVIQQVVPAALLITATVVTADPRFSLGGALYLAATAFSTLMVSASMQILSPFTLAGAWAADSGVVVTLVLAAVCFGVSRISTRVAQRT